VRGLTFADEIETANRYAAELRGQGVETIVVLLHEGGAQSAGGPVDGCVGLAGPIVGIVGGLDRSIDVVVSGHTHQAYNCVLDGRGGQRELVRAGGHRHRPDDRPGYRGRDRGPRPQPSSAASWPLTRGRPR
jgi:2',3'-cyclic-nucleotide 2'-phosphodiesterase (5'-nucleotidase family)